MADKKITDLSLLSSPDATDVFAIVDVDASETKKTTLSVLQESIFNQNTSSFVTHADTSSLLTSASYWGSFISFYKGDGTTFELSEPLLSREETGSFFKSASMSSEPGQDMNTQNLLFEIGNETTISVDMADFLVRGQSGSFFKSASISTGDNPQINLLRGNETSESLSLDNVVSFDQLLDVQDYTATSIPDGYLPVWNSGSQEWQPGRPDFEQGKTRLFVAAARSNTNTFYFNSQTRTSDTSASPVADSAFMLVSSDLDTITFHLRSSTSVTASVDIFKNADGSAFSSATSIVTPQSKNLVADTISTYSFTGLTINQFDSIHIQCTPGGAGDFYGIVEIV